MQPNPDTTDDTAPVNANDGEPEDPTAPVVQTADYDGGKLITTYFPAENVVELAVEGKPKLRFADLVGLGNFGFNAAQFVADRGGAPPLEEIIAKMSEGCGDPACHNCGSGETEPNDRD